MSPLFCLKSDLHSVMYLILVAIIRMIPHSLTFCAICGFFLSYFADTRF